MLELSAIRWVLGRMRANVVRARVIASNLGLVEAVGQVGVVRKEGQLIIAVVVVVGLLDLEIDEVGVVLRCTW